MKEKFLFWSQFRYFIGIMIIPVGLAVILGIYFVQLYNEGEALALLNIRHNILYASTSFNNTILKSMSVIDATSKSVEYMQSQKTPIKEIEKFLVKQTPVFRRDFNINFTSLYGLVQDHYVDGNKWTPPQNYKPKQRPWYIKAMKESSRTTLVPPYKDAETSKMVMSMVAKLSDGKSLIVVDSYLDDVIKYIDLLQQGIGEWCILDTQGTVVFSREQKLDGQNLLKNVDDHNKDLHNYLSDPRNEENIQKKISVNGKKSVVHHLKLSGNWTCLYVADYEKLQMNILKSLKPKFASITGFVIVLWFLLSLSLCRIQRNYMKAAAADHSKSLFFAMVSHELRTPLNSIIGLSRILKNFKNSEADIQKYLSHIIDGGETLIRIVNDILNLSKLEANKLTVVKEFCKLPELVAMVRENFIFKSTQLNNQIVCHVDDDFPMVELDQARVKQVLFNLIGNAVKFTENGVITVTGTFKRKNQTTGKLIISISDTGCGISEQEQKHIFEPFVSAINSMRHGGAGLGLAICSRLTKKMNGKLEVQSELGKGSCFTVTLKNVAYKENKNIKPIESKPCNSEPVKNLRFLLCDDIELNLKVLSLTLNKNFNIQSVSVNSAQKALETLENEKFDALLTDMWMPEMNGDELLQKIRKNPQLSSMPVYVITADVSLLKSWKDMNFTGAISKPISIDELSKIISEISR